MKRVFRRALGGALASAIAATALAPPALADSYKETPIETSRKLEWSVNIGATSDYVFRGYSQSAGDPVIQGGADLSYGMFYAGVWASGLDFGDGAGSANSEVDFYAGLKHSFGPIELDAGVIYYLYPNAKDSGAELDFVELKLGASTTIQKFSAGATAFYSPEYTGNLGPTWTFEGTVGYELPSFQSITPTLSSTIGTTQFEEAGNTDYVYWNAGISFLAAEKLTLDFRYWDTDVASSACQGPVFGCDERFVASVSVSLP